MGRSQTSKNVLPAELSEALRGLQLQAGVVTEAIPGNPQPGSLSEAHRLMANHKDGVREVLKCVKETDTPVPDVKPEALRQWLESNDSLWLSHEKPTPPIYVASVDEGTEPGSGVYFITTYWGDVQGCAGHAFSREDALKLMQDALEPGTITFVEEESEVRQTLLSKLRRPDLVSHVATVAISR